MSFGDDPEHIRGSGRRLTTFDGNADRIRPPSMNPPDSIGIGGHRSVQAEAFEAANTATTQAIRLFPATFGSDRQGLDLVQRS